MTHEPTYSDVTAQIEELERRLRQCEIENRNVHQENNKLWKENEELKHKLALSMDGCQMCIRLEKVAEAARNLDRDEGWTVFKDLDAALSALDGKLPETKA